MRRAIVITLLAVLSVSQDNLMALGSCLGNCAICPNNEPYACSGQQYVQCIKGYNGTDCQLKPTFANQVMAMNAQQSNPGTSMWQLSKTMKCVFKNSKLKQQPIYVLGEYIEFDYNQLTLDILPYYQYFTLSFNLVRGIWTPFSDLMRVAVLDQDDNILYEHFIEFYRRDQINIKKNTLKCNNQLRLIEKYQIEGAIDTNTQTKLVIKFEGMMFSEATWALTDVKLAFGCTNFLLYNGVQCKTCRPGYYQVKDVNGDVVSCNPCPLNCAQCSSQQLCQTCEDGFVLSKAQCSNKYSINRFNAPHRILSCQNHQLQISNTQNNQEKLDLQFGPLPSHQKVRVTFFIAYTSMALSNYHNLAILIDGLKQKDLDSWILEGVQQRSYQICEGFGKEGYFQFFKFVSPYIEHNKNSIKIVIKGDQGIKIGIEQVQVQYDEPIIQPVEGSAIQPKPQSLAAAVQKYDKQILSPPAVEPVIKKSQLDETEKPFKQNEKMEQKKPQSEQTQPQQTQSQQTQVEEPEMAINSTDEQNIEQNQSKGNLQRQSSQDKQVQADTMENNQKRNSTQAQPQPINNMTVEKNGQKQPKDQLKKQQNYKEAVEVTSGQVVRISTHVHKPSQIAKSMWKLQNNKWNIRIGIKTGKNLIISLYYPIEIEHFPYFVAKLLNKNISVVPRVLDKSKQEQQLHFDIKYSLLGENIDLFMAEKPPTVRKNTRNLQQQNNLHLSTVRIERFDYLTPDEWRTIERFSAFFQVLSWAVISSTIILCFLGKSVITQRFTLLLQTILLHTFIFEEYLPINLRSSLQGLHRMINLNYFSNNAAESIEKWVLGNVIQSSPTKFTEFNKDINFTRLVYPCIIINLVYLTWYLLLKLLKCGIQTKDNEITANSVRGLKIRLYIVHLAERGMNFWCQIWQYQYIVFAWAACVQFYNLNYPIDADRSQTANSIFCIVCFILVIILPIFTTVRTRKAYDRMDYLQYCYTYRNIFFLQLPYQTLPTNHHNLGIVIKNVRYLLIVLLVAYVGDFPIQCLVCLVVVHFGYLLYINLAKMETKPICLLLNMMELIFLMILGIGMLVAVSFSRTILTNEYMVIGSVLVIVCLLLTAVGLAQVLYYICNQLGASTLSAKERYSISQEAEQGQ